jgi:hypothetical protein
VRFDRIDSSVTNTIGNYESAMHSLMDHLAHRGVGGAARPRDREGDDRLAVEACEGAGLLGPVAERREVVEPHLAAAG